ncbi:MAG: hypothetical protein LUQ32_03100 [Methanomicrobiales archaeon]|nr:hypothetical protein [Methanomicrobiales archaeon]
MARLNINMDPPREEDAPIAAPPAGDIDVKFLKLQEEMDLLKTSIKKLLIDIRDRLNEKDNPFLHPGISYNTPNLFQDDQEAEGKDADSEESPAEGAGETEEDVHPGQKTIQEELASMLRANGKMPPASPFTSQKTGEKLRLRKVHRLFGWTSKIINRYGHDRLEILLQAYTSMGYLTDYLAGQIREIGRLLPASLGELHVIGPDEFVSELYILNRILDPKDNTLDEDMIEVLMTHRVQSPVAVPRKAATKESDQVFEWIDSMDRT